MQSYIDYASAEQIVSTINEINYIIILYTPQQAAEALNIVTEDPVAYFNVANWVGGNQLATMQSASQLYSTYAQSGYITDFQAIGTGPIYTANFTEVLKNSGALTEIGALLFVDIPTFIASALPLVGLAVAITGIAYEICPEFFEWGDLQLKRLFGFEDTHILPAVVDSTSHVHFAKAAVDKLKLMVENLKTVNRIHATVEQISYNFCVARGSYKMDTRFPEYIYNSNRGHYFIVYYRDPLNPHVTASKLIFASENPLDTLEFYSEEGLYDTLSLDHVYSKDQEHYVYYASITHITTESYEEDFSYLQDPRIVYNPFDIRFATSEELDTLIKNLSWYSFNNDATTVEHYPPGIIEWEGDSIVDYTQNSIEVVTSRETLSTDEYVRVQLPIDTPRVGVSNDPILYPNPTDPTPGEAYEPYVKPYISEEEYPLELPYPAPEEMRAPVIDRVPMSVSETLDDPQSDPSQLPDEHGPPNSTTEFQIPAPTDYGETPSTDFPLPDLIPPFPDIVPKPDAQYPTGRSGLIHVYNPTNVEIMDFGKWLWVTYQDATIDKIWNNPFDGILGAFELYCNPEVNATKEYIRSGFLVADTLSNTVKERYATIDCGSVIVPEAYGNYLDYSPYSKAHAYLPFIGIVELNADDIIGHAVNIKYHIDCYNGSCIAQITVAKGNYEATLYQFSGNCGVDIPLSGGSQAAIKAGMISAAATGIASVIGGIGNLLMGNIGGAMGTVAYGIGGAVAQAVSHKSSVQHSGSFGASYGAMGIKKPYLIVKRPIEKQILNYNDLYGLPAHKRVRIGDCTGFLRVREVDVVSPLATDEEKTRIEELLKAGVYVD